MTSIERLLELVEANAPHAAEELFTTVYDELRKLARDQLRKESPGQTLQPTALVNEVYLRIVAPSRDQAWDSKGHFFAAAAEAMRRILVDRARRKKAVKRGGGQSKRVEFDLNLLAGEQESADLISLDDALKELAVNDPLKAKLVVMRYFGGMSMEDACTVLGVSRTTGHRYWRFARAWLFNRISCDRRSQVN